MAENLTIRANGDCEVMVKRSFDAPRHRVFDAFVRPELVKRWLLGPDGWSMPLCDMDPRFGGAYRWAWQKADGTRMGVRGVFREVAPAKRIVHTEQFEPAWYPGEALVTTRFVEEDGRTTLTATIRYPSQEARDVALNSPMKEGMAMSYDRLERLLTPASSRAH